MTKQLPKSSEQKRNAPVTSTGKKVARSSVTGRYVSDKSAQSMNRSVNTHYDALKRLSDR